MKIVFDDFLGPDGIYTYPTKTITLQKRLRGFIKIEVFIHEFSHYLLHLLLPYTDKPQFLLDVVDGFIMIFLKEKSFAKYKMDLQYLKVQHNNPEFLSCFRSRQI